MVVYLAESEGKHYAEEGKPAAHIFRDVMRVAKWLDANPQK